MLIKCVGTAVLIMMVTVLLTIIACIRAAGRADKLIERMKWR
ncbi:MULTISPECIES: hypothetical protein [Clostridium]|nr:MULTISPECIES: hypothetical protein [Clostridium]